MKPPSQVLDNREATEFRLKRLEERRRAAAKLRAEGLTLEAIGARLGCTSNGARSLLAKGAR